MCSTKRLLSEIMKSIRDEVIFKREKISFCYFKFPFSGVRFLKITSERGLDGFSTDHVHRNCQFRSAIFWVDRIKGFVHLPRKQQLKFNELILNNY